MQIHSFGALHVCCMPGQNIGVKRSNEGVLSEKKVLIGTVSEEFGGTLFGHPITSRSLTIAPVLRLQLRGRQE